MSKKTKKTKKTESKKSNFKKVKLTDAEKAAKKAAKEKEKAVKDAEKERKKKQKAERAKVANKIVKERKKFPERDDDGREATPEEIEAEERIKEYETEFVELAEKQTGKFEGKPVAAFRQSVRFFYDLQKLRIMTGNRATNDAAELAPEDRLFVEVRSESLNDLERIELKQIDRMLSKFPISKWLLKQKGCGPTMAACLIAEIDIERAGTVSALWQYCGLGMRKDGTTQRRTKGEKNDYNSFLRTKVVGVLADCMIKAGSDWRRFYDNYKTRKQNTIVDVCMACEGTKKSLKGESKGKKCSNCGGTGGPAPWGESDGHRARAALRYMMKQFLKELWIQWRTLEKLPVTDDYATAMLKRKHGDHRGVDVQRL